MLSLADIITETGEWQRRGVHCEYRYIVVRSVTNIYIMLGSQTRGWKVGYCHNQRETWPVCSKERRVPVCCRRKQEA